MNRRLPTHDELRLLEFLIRKSKYDFTKLHHCLVENMSDGGMGSLLIFPTSDFDADRIFGETISEYMFNDADGIYVIATLSIDKNGDLFELDMWKTNFSPLISFPREFDI